jgi:alcohol dehydrogenase class IV
MVAFQSNFFVQTTAVRVRFGETAAEIIRDEVAALGCSRALVLSTSHQRDTAALFAEAIGSLAAGVFTGAEMHTPVNVTLEALAVAEHLNVDCYVAVGGGSTTGLGKALALRTDRPQIVVPTTYAGSEATAILGQTENGRKTTITDPRVQPEVILYDAGLVRSLPVGLTVASALNAMAHAAEALYAKDRNPLTTVLAQEGLAAFVRALPSVVANPYDLVARSETLYGAWLCGTVLGQVGMALHHKLCHVLGGSFDLPHAETHAVILPHAMAYNAQAVPDLLAPLDTLLGPESLHDFAKRMGAPLALRDLGMKEEDLERAAEIATLNPYWNPRPVEKSAILELLKAAWRGERPVGLSR